MKTVVCLGVNRIHRGTQGSTVFHCCSPSIGFSPWPSSGFPAYGLTERERESTGVPATGVVLLHTYANVKLRKEAGGGGGAQS